MDDLTIAKTHTVQTRWKLAGLEKLIKWTRMKFSAKMSRSVVIGKGNPSERFIFKIAPIPTVKDPPIKCLDQFFERSLKDTTNVKNIGEQLEQWLGTIHKSEL